MSKLLTVILLAGALLFGTVEVYAADVSVGTEYSLEQLATSSENTYVVAERINLAGTVVGDALILGEALFFSGTTTEDLMFVAREVTLSGTVEGDTRFLAGEARIGGSYAGDLMVVAGSALFQSDFRGAGDTRVYAPRLVYRGEHVGDIVFHGRTVEINGVVEGDVIVTFREHLVIGDEARIAGSVFYEGPREPRVSSGAIIEGELDGEIIVRPKRSDMYLAELGDVMKGLGFLFALSSAFASVLLVLLFPRFSNRTVRYVVRRGMPSIGYGALLLVGGFVLGLITLLSILGFYLGVFMLVGLLLVGMLAALLTPALAGALIAQWLVKEPRVIWYWVIAGVIALELIIFIPVFGPALRLLLYLAVLGSLARGIYDVWWTRRKDQTES